MKHEKYNPSGVVIRLADAFSENELIKSFSIAPTNISVVIEAKTEELIISTGMTAMHHGHITLPDIYRALQAATSIPNQTHIHIQVGTELFFEIDSQKITNQSYPIGISGKLLSVGIKLVPLPLKDIDKIKALCDAFQHRLVSITAVETLSLNS